MLKVGPAHPQPARFAFLAIVARQAVPNVGVGRLFEQRAAGFVQQALERRDRSARAVAADVLLIVAAMPTGRLCSVKRSHR